MYQLDVIPQSDPYLITFINICIVIIVTISLLVYRFVFPKKRINLLILLIIITTVATASIFRDGIYRSGDMRTHLPFLMGFYQNLQEGNIVPLWMGETCGHYGCPVFEFEYMLPYYIGALLHFVGFSFLMSVKLLLALPFIASGFTMYLWAKDEFGKTPGFVATLLYLFAPYHLLVTHFKGSVGEALAFVFIPLLFLFGKKLIETNSKIFFFLLALSVVGILLSNSSSTIGIAPFAAGYGIIIWIAKEKRKIIELILFFCAYVYGLLLAAFYWMPALFEVKHTWLSFTTYGNFMPILQYIYSPTFFGLLNQGHHGEYHPLIGYPQLLGVIIAVVLIVQKKIEKKLRFILAYFLFSFFFLFFMFFPLSKPIWDNVTLLHSFIGQIRLLTPLALITAAIFAIVIRKVKQPLLLMIICYLIVTSTVLNWANRAMRPTPTDPIAQDVEIYTEYYQADNPLYLQRYKAEVSIRQGLSKPPPPRLEFIKGNGSYVQLARKQEMHHYVVQVNQDAVIRENTLYFPGWTLFVNGKTVPINYENTFKGSFAKITFPLKKGLYEVELKFLDTPIRSLAKNISLWSLLGSVFYFLLLLVWKAVGLKRKSK